MSHRAVAVVKVSHGGAQKHLAYISRPEALRPAERSARNTVEGAHENERMGNIHDIGSHSRQRNPDVKSPSSNSCPEVVLRNEAAELLEQSQEDREGRLQSQRPEPIWTWNAPSYVTGDKNGARLSFEKERKAHGKREEKRSGIGKATSSEERQFTLEEKIENARAYFSLLSDSEKRRSSLNSYRIVLTIGRPTSDYEMREAVNSFLYENFPSAQALVALHRNTEHQHAHVYVHARQLDGQKIDLKQRYFRLDESWAKVCAEQFREPSIYQEHLRLKAETADYRRREKLARQAQEQLPAKPGRWADKFDVQHGLAKPWDDRWVGRLKASARVAQAKVEYLRTIKSSDGQLEEAAQQAQALELKLNEVAEKRAASGSAAKQSLPAEIITLEEQKEISVYTSAVREHKLGRSREIAADSGRADAQQMIQVELPFSAHPIGQLAFEFHAEVRDRAIGKEAKFNAKSPGRKSTIDRKQSRQKSYQDIKNLAPKLEPRTKAAFAQERLKPVSWKTHEERIRSAQSFVLEALRHYGQDEALLNDPQKYVFSLSDKVRDTLRWNFGLSIQGLGYTREAWANTVLINAKSVLAHLREVTEQAALCEEQVQRVKEALDKDESKILSVLAGSQSSYDQETAVERSPLHPRGEGQRAGPQDVMAKEHETTESYERFISDRDEHIFIR